MPSRSLIEALYTLNSPPVVSFNLGFRNRVNEALYTLNSPPVVSFNFPLPRVWGRD